MIRIGIIGAGPNGAGHADYYSRSPRTGVVAIADPVVARASELAQRCGAIALADYHQLIERVDAVVVSSPNFLHRGTRWPTRGPGSVSTAKNQWG